MYTLYRLELLLALRDKALPGTPGRAALDRIVNDFEKKIVEEVVKENSEYEIREQWLHSPKAEVEFN